MPARPGPVATKVQIEVPPPPTLPLSSERYVVDTLRTTDSSCGELSSQAKPVVGFAGKLFGKG